MTDGASAVYDPEGQRMLVVDFQRYGIPRKYGVTRVLALELKGQPAWHRFCAIGTVPTISLSSGEKASLAADGLFLFDGGSFRFGLATPYCDSDPP